MPVRGRVLFSAHSGDALQARGTDDVKVDAARRKILGAPQQLTSALTQVDDRVALVGDDHAYGSADTSVALLRHRLSERLAQIGCNCEGTIGSADQEHIVAADRDDLER